MRVNPRLITVLLILAAIFAFLKFGIERRSGDEPLFPDFRPELAVRINLKGRDTTAVLEKKGDIWLVTSEDSFPSEVQAVRNILDKVASFSRKDIISSNPEKQSIYQVDSAGIAVSIEDSRGDTLAWFLVGKPGPDYRSTYVRDGASSVVILAPDYLPPAFDRGKRTWQDRAIYSMDPSEIVELRVVRPGETIELERDESGRWYASLPESTACDQNTVSRLLRTLAYLMCDEFAGRMPVAGSGLDRPDSSLAFTTADGGEEHLLFGSETEAKRIHAKRVASDIVYLIAASRVKTLLPTFGDLRTQEAGDARVEQP